MVGVLLIPVGLWQPQTNSYMVCSQQGMMLELLKQFEAKNNRVPHRIIMYR